MEKTPKETFLLEALKTVVDGIAHTFGPRCEVVLHDLRNPHRSIIKIANGHITGRTVGSPITDFGLKLLTSKSQNNLFLNYSTSSNTGGQLKSSSFLFRDMKNKPFAALCINFDVTEILGLNRVIESIFEPTCEKELEAPLETFQSDTPSMLAMAIDRSLRSSGKSVPMMKKEDRERIVTELSTQGFFEIKGAVKALAHKLGVSKFTIYNYLKTVNHEIT